ncbi:MAG: hypothetical protein IBX68_09780 [Dehalococcoidia bacterium]|nr:hypothetical protein [Dehalococcoidia bacterium]
MLRTEYIGSLRCVEHAASLHGEPVRMIMVFSPKMAGKLGLTIRELADLRSHPEALLFEGYTDQAGQVYVADRRSPLTDAVFARRNGNAELKREIRKR